MAYLLLLLVPALMGAAVLYYRSPDRALGLDPDAGVIDGLPLEPGPDEVISSTDAPGRHVQTGRFEQSFERTVRDSQNRATTEVVVRHMSFAECRGTEPGPPLRLAGIGHPGRRSLANALDSDEVQIKDDRVRVVALADDFDDVAQARRAELLFLTLQHDTAVLLPLLQTMAERGDAERRMISGLVLRHFYDHPVAQALASSVLPSDGSEVRFRAAALRLDGPILERLAAEVDPKLAGWAVEQLDQNVAERPRMALLVRALCGEPRDIARTLGQLSNLRREAAVEVVEQALAVAADHHLPQLLDGLSRYDRPAARDRLHNLAQRADVGLSTRQDAVQALTRIDPAIAETILLELLENGDGGAQEMAATELGRSGTVRSVMALRKAAAGRRSVLQSASELSIQEIQGRLEGVQPGTLSIPVEGTGALSVQPQHGGLSEPDS